MSRFYREKFPRQGDVVMTQVIEVFADCAYLSLLEYGGMKAIIIASEASRKLLNSMNRMFSVGKKVVAQVLHVDQTKGYIDLSKKHLSEQDLSECETRYHTALAANRIVRRLIELHELDAEAAFEDWGWDMDHACCAAMSNNKNHPGWKKLPVVLHTDMEKLLLARFETRPVCVRAIIEVCLPSGGVEGLKEVFSALKLQMGDSCRCRILSSPRYLVTAETSDVSGCKSLMSDCLEKMRIKIENEPHGLFNLVEAPSALANETLNIENLLDKAEEQEEEDDEWE
jgi:translation initiation factor 2 subunit 1